MGVSSFKAYLTEVGSYPLLDAEQEKELARAARNGDASARELLINSNLRLVINVAKKYRNAKLSLLDLISEGNMGLITAVEKYNPDLGYRFTTCAIPWIKQAILKAITDNGRTIRLPAHVFQLMSRYKKAIAGLVQRGETVTDEKLASMLNVEVDKIKQLREIKHDTISLSTSLGTDEDSDTLEDLVCDPNATLPSEYTGKIKRRELIDKAIKSLKPRTQTIVKMRYGLGIAGVDPEEYCSEHTLEDIGLYVGLTRERVRQIEKQAIAELRNLLDKNDFIIN